MVGEKEGAVAVGVDVIVVDVVAGADDGRVSARWRGGLPLVSFAPERRRGRWVNSFCRVGIVVREDSTGESLITCRSLLAEGEVSFPDWGKRV